MSSRYRKKASFGNDGDKTTYFGTDREDNAWWAVDFGAARTSVTGVRITNVDKINYNQLINFTVGLTDQNLKSVKGPISDLPFLKCATHGSLGRAQSVSLSCEHPRYARRRYLFVAAKVNGSFHVSEVEVFDESIVVSATGFREFGDCAFFVDKNHASCEAVTSLDNPLDFVLKVKLSQPQSNFDVRITLRDGNCGDASQVHVYTEEKPLNAGPFDGYYRRCHVVEAEPPVDGATVCSFACGGNKRGCDYVFVRVFGRYGPVRSLCEVELIGN